MASCCLRGSVGVAQNGCAHSLSPRPSLTDLSCAFTQTLASLQPEQSPCLGLCGLNTGCVCGQAGSSCVAAVARVLGRDPAPSQTPASPCGAGPQRDGSACAQRRRVGIPRMGVRVSLPVAPVFILPPCPHAAPLLFLPQTLLAF